MEIPSLAGSSYHSVSIQGSLESIRSGKTRLGAPPPPRGHPPGRMERSSVSENIPSSKPITGRIPLSLCGEAPTRRGDREVPPGASRYSPYAHPDTRKSQTGKILGGGGRSRGLRPRRCGIPHRRMGCAGLSWNKDPYGGISEGPPSFSLIPDIPRNILIFPPEKFYCPRGQHPCK